MWRTGFHGRSWNNAQWFQGFFGGESRDPSIQGGEAASSALITSLCNPVALNKHDNLQCFTMLSPGPLVIYLRDMSLASIWDLVDLLSRAGMSSNFVDTLSNLYIPEEHCYSSQSRCACSHHAP